VVAPAAGLAAEPAGRLTGEFGGRWRFSGARFGAGRRVRFPAAVRRVFDAATFGGRAPLGVRSNTGRPLLDAKRPVWGDVHNEEIHAFQQGASRRAPCTHAPVAALMAFSGPVSSGS
jgi:hypothetical protein